jgi:hypothetical protein
MEYNENPFLNFGPTEEDRLAAKKLAYMRAGLGVLAANKPGPYQQNTLGLLAQGGIHGLDSYGSELQRAGDERGKKAMLGMKAAEFHRNMEQQQNVRAFGASLPPDQQQAFMANPQEFMKAYYREKLDTKPQIIPANAAVLPRGATEPTFTNTKASGPQSDLGKLAADFQAGHITKEQFDEKYKKLTAPSQPLVTVDNRQENEFNKKVGAQMGEQYSELLRADMNAPATIGKYNRLGSLLSSVNTGKFKGTTTELKAAAKSLGIDLTAMGVSDDLGPAQAARALSNQLALELRNPAGGAGMPGALSDRDREFLVQSIPSLENDPAAVGKMIEYRVKLAEREQQVAKMARAYRKKNGKFDEGFFDELQEWSAKNPLFKGAAPTPAASGWSIKPK